MSIVNFISEMASLNNAVIIGLSTLLGKIWANHIAAKEDATIKMELIKLQRDLDTKNETFSRSINHQNDLIKHAIQGAHSESALIFEKQFESVNLLWQKFLKIKHESIQFFKFHQILTAKEKADPKTFANSLLKPLTPDEIESALKKIMQYHTESMLLRPLIPASIYNLFNTLVIFYARLGVNQLTNKNIGTIPCWFGTTSEPDYSVKQIIEIAVDINMILPSLSDDCVTFENWKKIVEERLLVDIQMFFNGSLDRKIKSYKQLELFTDLQVEMARN